MDPGHTQKAPEYYPSEDTPGSTEQAEEAKPRNLKTTLVVRAVQLVLAGLIMGLTGYMIANGLDGQSPAGHDLSAEGALILSVGIISGLCALLPFLNLFNNGDCGSDWLSTKDAMHAKKENWEIWLWPLFIELFFVALQAVGLYFAFAGLRETRCLPVPDFVYKGRSPCSILVCGWAIAVLAQGAALAGMGMELYRVIDWSRVLDTAVVTNDKGQHFDRRDGKWKY